MEVCVLQIYPEKAGPLSVSSHNLFHRNDLETEPLLMERFSWRRSKIRHYSPILFWNNEVSAIEPGLFRERRNMFYGLLP